MRYLPELLSDMWALGCYPDLIAELLRPLLVNTKNIHALDLGCGKGAAAITLARKFGIHVTGIDLSESFLAEARRFADKYQVNNLCQFRQEDIRSFTKTSHSYNLVIYVSLGQILGNTAETIFNLRRRVHPNGYILIDTAFLKKDIPLKRAGYTHLKSRGKTAAALQKWGDVLVNEKQIKMQQTAQRNRNYLTSLRRQSKKLIRRIPEVKNEIESFISEQAEECDFIESNLVECIWILQKRISDPSD